MLGASHQELLTLVHCVLVLLNDVLWDVTSNEHVYAASSRVPASFCTRSSVHITYPGRNLPGAQLKWGNLQRMNIVFYFGV